MNKDKATYLEELEKRVELLESMQKVWMSSSNTNLAVINNVLERVVHLEQLITLITKEKQP